MRQMICVLVLLIAAGLLHPAEAATKRKRPIAGSPQQILCSIIDAACKKKVSKSKNKSSAKQSKKKSPAKKPAAKSAPSGAAATAVRSKAPVIPKPKPVVKTAAPPPEPEEKPALKTAEPPPKPVEKPEDAKTAEPPPKPAEKPAITIVEPPPKPAEKPTIKIVESPPKPPEKPLLKTAEPPVTPEKPKLAPPAPELSQPAKPEAAPAQGTDARPPEPNREDAAACRAALTAGGATFSVPETLEATGACSVANPVQLSAVTTKAGTVALPGRPILNCIFARQFTTWLADVAGPTVGAQSDAGLAAFSTGPGYQCRGRNGDASNKVSEHATGNAIDIDGVILADKRRIAIEEVANPQSPSYRMLMALRVSACGYFTTVLGPGSNAAHATHYHLDLGVHGKSGNYRICE